MSFSPEKIIMLLVAGLGGYAVYRMTRATPQQAPDGANLPILAPDMPGVIVPLGIDVVTDGDHLRVSEGRFYRARFETPEDVATVAARTGTLGLAGSVYTNAESARAAGFPEWSLANPTPNTRWFAGSSTVSGNPSRPPGLALMWTARPS